MMSRSFPAFFLATFALLPMAWADPTADEEVKPRRFKAPEVFKSQGPVIYESDFAARGFELLAISEDDRYARPAPDPRRLVLKEAPGLASPAKAAWFTVPRAANSFRSEISLPHEDGFRERWYALALYVPASWEIDRGPASDIVIQWHAIPGKGRATYPNLDIAIRGDKWVVHQSYGNALDKPVRPKTELETEFRPGTWSNWIISAKWSAGEDGRIRIWRNEKLVFEHQGQNAYGDIGVEYTPYLKTGIYHPEWNLSTERKKLSFEAEKTPVSLKEISVAKIAVGNESATLEGMKKLLPAIPEVKAGE